MGSEMCIRDRFITGALKGGQGQFFTPRNVIQLLVALVDPKPEDLILDPACGSGGFLIEVLKHKWEGLDERARDYNWSDLALAEERTATAIKTIFALEVDEFLSKVAKAYMAIMGDGRGGIFCEDSLESPAEWREKTRQSIALRRFDIVLTNPPFGKEIKVVGEDKLEQYALAHFWRRNRETNTYEVTSKLRMVMAPQILFVERCLQFLKDGGRLGIILPETFFHAPTLRYFMQFLSAHNLIWIVDLPHNTFSSRLDK